MKVIEEPNGLSEVNKEVARYNRKVMWYVTKRTAKMVLVAGAAILVAKTAFDMAVEHEVKKQISE
jgi:hypothetical protein